MGSEWRTVTRRQKGNRQSVFSRLGGKYQSLFDQTSAATSSVFVRNFPTHFSLHEFRCIGERFGLVIDAFIAPKKTIKGEMFGFLRFARSVDIQKVVEKINKLKIGNLNLFANISKYNRIESGKAAEGYDRKKATPVQANRQPDANQVPKCGPGSGAFVDVARGSYNFKVAEVIHLEAVGIVGGDCMVLGKVRNMGSMPNLYQMCLAEGFNEVSIKYMGGLWVSLEFNSLVVCEKLKAHVGIQSWFESVVPWSPTFVIDERLVWLEVEGIPLHTWGQDSITKVVSKWGRVVDFDNSNGSNRYSTKVAILTSQNSFIWEMCRVAVSNHMFTIRVRESGAWSPKFNDPIREVMDDNIGLNEKEEERVEVEDVESEDEIPDALVDGGIPTDSVNKSEDMFGLNELIKRTHCEKNHEPKFPPGFTPVDVAHEVVVEVAQTTDHTSIGEAGAVGGEGKDAKGDGGCLYSEIPAHGKKRVLSPSRGSRHSGSLINELNETIELGEKLGLNMKEVESRLNSLFEDLGDKPHFQ